MTSAVALPTVADLDREMVRRRGLREFVRRAWSQVEPARLVWGWHLDAVCEHLEAVARDEIRKRGRFGRAAALVVNVPSSVAKVADEPSGPTAVHEEPALVEYSKSTDAPVLTVRL